ncbi:MAG: hypothetical protein IKL93_01575 [Clostridia bacterium]|nr:hypothetical protein [Clostridia bacterium]
MPTGLGSSTGGVTGVLPEPPEDVVPEDVVPELDEPELDEPELDEPELDEPELDEPELDEPGLDEPELDEPGLDEPGLDEPWLDEVGFDEPELTPDEPSAEVVSEEISLLSVLFDDESSLFMFEACEELGLSVFEPVSLVPQAAKTKPNENTKSNAINFFIFLFPPKLSLCTIMCTMY